MTWRGGSPTEVGEVLARARRNAGVTEIPAVDDSAAPPGAGEGPLNVAQEDVREEARPRPGPDGNKAPLERPAPPVHAPKYCASCSAPILWAQLVDEAGQRVRKDNGKFKAIPVDYEPVAGGNVVLWHRTSGGIVARVLRRGEQPPPGARLRVSHFATCPAAANHRRRP